MVLVGLKENGRFFRAITVDENDVELQKTIMGSDAGEELTFQIMLDSEFEQWLESQ